MRVNDRGGYDVLIMDGKGRYLAGDNVNNPVWVSDEDAARADDDDASAMLTAAEYGLVGDDGSLMDGYSLIRVPWVNVGIETDPKFMDPETGEMKMEAIRRYVFGDGPIDASAAGRRTGDDAV